MARFDLIIEGGTLVLPGGRVEAAIGLADGRLAA